MSKLMQYAAFVATVDLGTLAKAARHLNLTPSAISKQLSSLERALGVTLLDRSNRTLRPTDIGKDFHRRCKAVLAAIRDAETEAVANRDALAGKIRLTLATPLSRSALLDLIAEFSSLHPQLRFELNVTDAIEDLVDGGYDFAFRIGKLADTRLRAVRLFDATPIFCASPGYLQRCGRPRRFAELQQHQLMVLSTLNLSAATQSLFRSERRTPLDTERHHSTNDINTLFQATMSGLCIAAMLDYMAAAEIEQAAWSICSRSAIFQASRCIWSMPARASCQNEWNCSRTSSSSVMRCRAGTPTKRPRIVDVSFRTRQPPRRERLQGQPE